MDNYVIVFHSEGTANIKKKGYVTFKPRDIIFVGIDEMFEWLNVHYKDPENVLLEIYAARLKLDLS